MKVVLFFIWPTFKTGFGFLWRPQTVSCEPIIGISIFKAFKAFQMINISPPDGSCSGDAGCLGISYCKMIMTTMIMMMMIMIMLRMIMMMKTQNVPNSTNFEASTSRFFMVIHLSDTHRMTVMTRHFSRQHFVYMRKLTRQSAHNMWPFLIVQDGLPF